MGKNDIVAAQTEQIGALMSQIMRSIHAVPPPFRKKPPPDLTLAQVRIIRILHGHGECTMKELANLAAVKMPTATGLVNRLERQKIVERFGDPRDRRVVRVKLTSKARRMADRHRRWRMRRIAEILEHLDEDELAYVARTMKRLVKIFSKITEKELDLAGRKEKDRGAGRKRGGK